MKKFSCSVLLTPIAIILQIVIVCGLGLILRAGTGSFDNKNHLPAMPDLYVALIDTDDYKRVVNKKTYVGLPDSHDFSKDKEFFALFPALYCSGMKVKDRYEVNYCTSWGKQLFDQQRVWRVWGVDLVDGGIIGTTPKLIYIGLLVAAASTGLSLVLGVLSLCFYWFSVVATLMSWISTIAIVATAGLSHFFVSKLVSSSKNLKVTGSGKIVAKWGSWYSRSMWLGCGLVIAASVLWTIMAWRRAKARKSNKKTSSASIPLIGRLRNKEYKNGTSVSYKHLSAEHDMLEPDWREQSPNPTSPPHHVTAYAGSPPANSGQMGPVTTRESAYEPMWHRTS